MNSGRWVRYLLLGSIALPAMLFSATAWRERNAEIADIKSQERAMVALVSEQIHQTIESDKLVLSIADDEIASVLTDRSTIHHLLEKLSKVEQISGIFITDSKGQLIDGNRTHSHPISVSNRSYFREARDDLDPSHIHVESVQTHANMALVLAKRLPSSDGTFHGLLAICVPQRYFDHLLGAANSHGNGMLILATPTGELLSSAPPGRAPHALLPTSVVEAIRASTHPISIADFPVSDVNGPATLTQIKPSGLIVGYAISNASVNELWLYDMLPSSFLLLLGLTGIATIGVVSLRGHAREELGHLRLHEETRRRRSIEEKMHHLQRMEAIGQLTAGIAHDFNNMLTAISANAEFLERSKDEKQHRYAVSILTAVERGAKLIRQMLTFARRQVLQSVVLDINEQLRGFSSLLSSAIAGRITVEYRLVEKVLLCSIDPTEFELAILNIATNAKHAMPSGGGLLIETRALCVTEAEPDLRTGSYVLIEITDHGCGMTPDVLEHAFEPFFTTRPLGEGSGLGLSQVFGFAKQAGGAARITSVLGAGTCVSLFLPLVKNNNIEKDRAMSREPRELTILVVDDTEDVLAVVVDSLELNGFTTVGCTTAADALCKLEAQSFDILITDIIMPGNMSGIELAQIARDHDHTMKIILMTGYSDQTISGGFPLLRKPFRSTELMECIETLLNADGSGRWN